MGIIGQRPESGVRISVERASTAAASPGPWRYEGTAATPEAEFPITATIDASGEVKVAVPSNAPGDLAEKIRLILRAVYKQKDGDERAPARKIVRWRAEK